VGFFLLVENSLLVVSPGKLLKVIILYCFNNLLF
jgi:hypothetical protein